MTTTLQQLKKFELLKSLKLCDSLAELAHSACLLIALIQLSLSLTT